MAKDLKFVEIKRSENMKNTKFKEYRFHEIEAYCCWKCQHLNVKTKNKMRCIFLHVDTEPHNFCDAFKR